MAEFLADLPRYAFLQYALLAGVLASIACGIVGTYVVTRRITSVAGAIAHSILGGMGAARYCQVVLGWSWFDPLIGAVLSAIAAAVVIAMVRITARQREDTVIASVWAIGMAIGLLFIFRTPGYNEDLMSYLFGSILMVTPDDLRLMGGLDVLVAVVALLFYNKFLAVCFDEEFARIRRVRVEAYHILLLCLTALTVVLLVTVVGIVMVIALLTLPAAAASHFSRKLWHMMVLSTLFTVLFTTAGMALSYGPDLPAGATIIIIAGAAYILVVFFHQAFYRAIRAERG